MLRTEYKEKALTARKWVLKMIHSAGSSHIGSNLSVIDIATVLYDVINLDAELKPDRDRVIWSKGWAAATAYYFLADKGIISDEELSTYGAPNSNLLGLVERGCRGIEASTGSMGHGLPIGVGFALAASRSAGEKWKTYVIMSDGEMNCGTTWESAALAAHHHLSNLVVIVDVNGLQAMGDTTEILNMHPLKDKWEAFGWEVRTVDGHDHIEIKKALTYPPLAPNRPICILANTIKGKGVPFMEGLNVWHYKNISTDDYQRAIAELV
jgi:transketolase